MHPTAFEVLDAIARGDARDVAGAQPWIHAFQTICWVTRDSVGNLALTADGFDAYRDLARPRSRERRPSRSGSRP
jgi:hypothetical protein